MIGKILLFFLKVKTLQDVAWLSRWRPSSFLNELGGDRPDGLSGPSFSTGPKSGLGFNRGGNRREEDENDPRLVYLVHLTVILLLYCGNIEILNLFELFICTNKLVLPHLFFQVFVCWLSPLLDDRG